MPITRSEGKGRKEQTPSSSEATTETSATGTTIETSATDATLETATESTATGTTATGSTDRTQLLPVTTAASKATTSGTLAPPQSTTMTLAREDNAAANSIEKAVVEHKEEQKRPPLRAPSKKGGGGGSTHSNKSKAYRIAKAKEELIRLKIELATAQLATLEVDDSEEDDISIDSKTEGRERVDNWLDDHTARPNLTIADGAPAPTEEIKNRPVEHRTEEINSQPGLTDLATAITQAVKAAQRPRYIELPFFNGAYEEWLPFRAAYFETEENFTAVENTNRLRKNLKGKAREAVEGLLITSSHPAEIMKGLESRFGRPESIARSEIDKIRNLPRLTDSPRDVCIFATKVSNITATLKTLNCVNYMYNPDVSRIIVDKLTPIMRNEYFRFVRTQPKEDPELLKIEKFLKEEAELCGPYASPEQVTPHETVPQQKKRMHRVNTATEQSQPSRCPVCDETGHSTGDCHRFKTADENQRWDIAKSKQLCFRCLRYRNRKHSCQPKPCGVNHCKRFHNRLLHYTDKGKTESEDYSGKTEAINSAWTLQKKQSYLKIVPVSIEGPRATIDTFALLDDGSTVTLIDDSIAKSVGATGPVVPLKIETVGDLKTTESASRKVNFNIRGLNSYEERIQARTIKNLRVSSQRISTDVIKGCKHLRDISKLITYGDVKPQILIGQDNWHLLMTCDMRKGKKSQPVASLTPLGWVLHGSQTRTLGRNIDVVSHVTEAREDNLDQLVKQYFELDALCIAPKKPKTDPEEQALRILERVTKKTEQGSYETGLLWRKEDVTFPDNYNNSLKRLFNIERKLDRDPKLKQKYTEQMEALTAKGYAELAPKQKTPQKTWYLPHFGVINPTKPEKLRVVHDAAAKTRGVALNDMLLKGPDLLQSLPGVIMRFRQHEIAVTADIKEMFMQVKLREQDRDALRYLWRGNRRDDQPPEEYRMTSLIFGASSSPSTAIYIKDLNAKQYEDTHPEAAAAIIRKHYVDDYLDSFKNIEEAVHTVKGVREIHADAGFELKQWKSNEPLLLQMIGEQQQTEEMELYKSEETTERVLGLIWKPKSDVLTFNLNLARIPPQLIEGKTPTKREALRIVMSLFDPLGFASPVTIRAKQILQEVWRRGTSWDDEIDEDLAEIWRDWTVHLKNLCDITIPRQYLHYSDATTIELHVFTDASESAYSAVLYWRLTRPNNDVDLSLIIAKARVAPLKLTSIPRLELQAAVMGARMAEAIIEEHDRKPDRKIFWTDSKTVLTWIRTGSRSYKPYVAHRLAAIEEHTTVNEWRWVPTKKNVADDATRDVPADFSKNHRWYKGPEFLYEDEESWPEETTAPTKEELSNEERVHHVTSGGPKLSEGLPEISRFSNWERLRYTTARVLQFIRLCRPNRQSVNYKRTQKNKQTDPSWKKTQQTCREQVARKRNTVTDDRFLPVTAEELKLAEELLMRSSQEDAFSSDIDDLKNERPIRHDSRLRQLSMKFENGSIKLRSRIEATQDMAESFKNPMIIDGDHPTVKLWIQNVHRQLHHAGVEAVVNECRQQYWVVRIRPTVRVLLRRCLFCRMKTQTPPYPRTGDLPQCRLAHHKRPFTYTGVDYFGPISVTVGRTRQKRYVAIFTCLTTRAIHLEIAGSLSTDSAIMALRRMIARRGCPTEIWSDNGTNLKAADKELRQTIDEATKKEAAKKTITWRFIPPGAPFMGGAWERMVRSVKTALNATLHERYPYEEVLSTLLAEVEYTVNSRPLTHVSVNPDDPEALTPNHFLLGGPGRVPQPGEFDEKDTVSTRSWRCAQRLADVFWTRWVREYLPELQNRREPHGQGPPVTVDSLVQIVDPNLPRNVWIRGRVIATYPGPDNVVRTVDVKTKGGILRRPVRKLVILPTDVVPVPEDIAT